MTRADRLPWWGALRTPRSTTLHRHRKLAESFGDDAGLYDRARPRYPAALVDYLLTGGVHSILDIGCGTGIAGSLFRDGNREVVGVEPDRRMAKLARQRGIKVEVSPFEEWNTRERKFDLLIAAQAWHWIDPKRGMEKAASALRDEGRLGIFWNVCSPPAVVQDEIKEIYSELAPDFFRYSVLLNSGSSRVESVAQNLEEYGPFGRPRHCIWRWSRRYTADEWLEHLITHSDHQALPKERRRPLFLAVSHAFERLGRSAEMRYETHLVLADRLPRMR